MIKFGDFGEQIRRFWSDEDYLYKDDPYSLRLL